MPPLSVMIKPASGLCNMRCAYCFYADEARHRDTASYGFMNDETLDALVRRAFLYADDIVSFSFQGGEPTLIGKDFYRKFLLFEKRYNTRRLRVNHAIQTNGYALDEEWARLFADGHFLVGVSLDGTKELHDPYRVDAQGAPTYERIRHNLSFLDRCHVEYNILCVVNNQIAAKGTAVFRSLKEFQYLQFIPCLDGLDGEKTQFSLDSQQYGRFLIEMFDLYEKAAYTQHPVSIRTFDNWIGIMLGMPPENCAQSGQCNVHFLVEADGGIYPCDFYVLDQWRLGNINEISFSRAAKTDIEHRFLSESFQRPSECAACPWFSLCRGGCKRDREPLLPDKPSSNHLCEGHRMFFKSRLAQMQKLAQYFASKSQSSSRK